MKQCAVDGCEKPGNMARGWCNRHYLRWYRHGDPEYQVPLHTSCVVDDCGKPLPSPRRNGLCEKHRARVRRHGNVQTVLPRRRPDASYQTVHARIRYDFGNARSHACVDCGHSAQQWSYDHADPAPLLSPEGFPYSLNPERYQPRCIACHVAFDQGREVTADAVGSQPAAR